MSRENAEVSGNLIKVEIVTPSRLVASDEVEMVVAPGEGGSFGVLHNHVPFLCALRTGEVKLKKGEKTLRYALSAGFFEMSENKVIILADGAERAQEIDVERAQAARDRSVKRLDQADTDLSIDIERAKAALLRAQNRLKIAEIK